MTTLSELRQSFARSPGCKFISPEVYMEYLTGHQALVRSDEPSANLMGLLDEATGCRFFVPAEEFSRRQAVMAEESR